MQAIAFDLGQVIFNFDYHSALERLEGRLTVSKQKVIEELYVYNFALDFEKGLVSEHDFFLKFKRAFLKEEIGYAEFIEIWSDIFSPNEKVVQLIESLRWVYPVYLISNINVLHFEFLFKKYPHVFGLFDELLLSYKLKSVKPELRIYQALKEKSGRDYSEIVYIDDRQDLISEAKRIGLDCIRFTSTEHLLFELSRRKIFYPNTTEKQSLQSLKEALDSRDSTMLVQMKPKSKNDTIFNLSFGEDLKKRINFYTLDLDAGINYLDRLEKEGLIIFVEGREFRGEASLKVFDPKKTASYSEGWQGSVFRSMIEDLQKSSRSVILVLVSQGNEDLLNGGTSKAKILLENFLVRYFSQGRDVRP